jgi:hypothetical protein
MSGTDLGGGFGAAAGGQGAHGGGELGGELGGDGLLHEEPVRGGAGLAHVPHLGGHGPFDGLVQVGVLEHDERCVAAQFHGGAQDVLGGVGHQALAHRGGAGEGDLPQAGVGQQRPGDPGGGRGGDDVEDAGGQAGVEHGLREVLGGERGELGGFEDHGAAGGDGGGDLAGGHGEREVPRGDEQARADGFVLDEDLVLALGGGEVAAVVADGFFGEPAQELGPVGDFAAGFGQGLAHFQGHQQGEVFGAFGDQVEGAAQDLARQRPRRARARTRQGP